MDRQTVAINRGMSVGREQLAPRPLIRSLLRRVMYDHGAGVEIDEDTADKRSRQLGHDLALLTWQSTPPQWPDVVGEGKDRDGLARLDHLG